MNSSGNEALGATFGRLYIVATPIGNLDDFSPRAIATLRGVDLIAAESIERARKLVTRFDLKTRLISFRESNRERVIPDIISAILSGSNAALISDGGAPLVSDPGRELVAEAVKNGIVVSPIPGPSAVTAALMVSPQAGDFCFIGFLPRSPSKIIAALLRHFSLDLSVVAFESPERIGSLLDLIAKNFGEEVEITLARELTKINETLYYGNAGALLSLLPNDIKGEITLVMKYTGRSAGEAGSPGWKEVALALCKRGVRDKDIAAALSKAFDVASEEIYNYLVKGKG